jgi:hypothetical protein
VAETVAFHQHPAGPVHQVAAVEGGLEALADPVRRLGALDIGQSRTAIDTTVGVVMAQNRCDQEAAVAMLKRASGSRNVKLRDIAASVIASVAQDPSVAPHFDA